MNIPPRHSSFLAWPHSRAGSIGVVLATLFLAVLGLNLWVSAGGSENGFLVLATFLTALGALVGVVLSAVAMVRHHERSLLAMLPLVIGALVLVFLAVEIFVGHD